MGDMPLFDKPVRVATGWCYLIPCAVTLPFHLVVFAALIRLPQMRKRSALRMMLSLTVCEILEVTFIGLGGLSLVIDTEMNWILNRATSIILQISWSTLLILHPAFVLQRLWLISSNSIAIERVPIWIGGCLYSIGYHSGGDDYHFDLARTSWISTVHSDGVPIFTVLFYGKMFECILGLAANVVVFGLMVSRRRRGLDRSRLKIYEARYLIQNSIQFAMITADMYGYNCVPPFEYLDQAVNLLWIAIVTFPPYLTLLANK